MEVKKIVLQTPGTFDPGMHRKERVIGKSETVPDQSMTVRQLYERFTVGGQLPPERVPVFLDGDLDSDDLEKLRDADVFVREQKARSVAEDIRNYEEQLKAENSKAKAERLKREQEAADRQYDEAAKRNAAKRPNAEPDKEGGAK